MKKLKESIFIKYLVIFTVTVLFLSCLKVVSCMLPDQRIQSNLNKSKALILEEGLYPQYFINNPDASYLYASYRIDTITEYAILGTAYTASNSSPLQSAFYNMGPEVIDMETIPNYIATGETQFTDRSQYWMGLTVIERFAYMFFDMASFRQFSLLVLGLLSFGVIILLYKRFGIPAAFSMMVSTIFVNLWVIPFSPNFYITFVLAFIFMLIILKKYNRNKSYAIYFFVFSMLTAYFDWMSTPLITFGLPMIVLILCYAEHEIKFFKGLQMMISSAIAWALGYAGMIVSKWVVGSFVLHKNIVKVGLARMTAGTSVRIEGDPDSSLGLALLSLKNNFFAMYPFTSQPTVYKYILFFGIIVIGIVLVILFHKPVKECVASMLLFVLSLAPFAWFIVLKGHCHIHYWFTYRIQMISVMAVVLSFILAIDTSRLFKCKEKMRC